MTDTPARKKPTKKAAPKPAANRVRKKPKLDAVAEEALIDAAVAAPVPDAPTAAPDGIGRSEIGKEQVQRAQDLDLIRQDRSLQLVPRMFVLNGDPKIRLQETQTIQGIQFNYAFSPMSAYELRVLHAVATMLNAKPRGTITSFDAADIKKAATAAWTAFGVGAKSFGKHVTEIRTSKRAIAELVGPTSGPALNRAYDALKMLAEVTIHMHDPAADREVSTRLLDISRDGPEIVIRVNPRLVKTVGERTVGAFSVLSKAELHAMQSESGVLLYTRLCAFIDGGSSRVIGQDRIEEYIWGDALPMTPGNSEQRKGRKKAIKRAFNELLGFGWLVDELTEHGHKSYYRIERPKLKLPPGTPEAMPMQQLKLIPDQAE